MIFLTPKTTGQKLGLTTSLLAHIVTLNEILWIDSTFFLVTTKKKSKSSTNF